MGGRHAVVAPPPPPSPIKGEGKFGMTNVATYLPLSAHQGGEQGLAIERFSKLIPQASAAMWVKLSPEGEGE
jgi:hypothetical protein